MLVVGKGVVICEVADEKDGRACERVLNAVTKEKDRGSDDEKIGVQSLPRVYMPVSRKQRGKDALVNLLLRKKAPGSSENLCLITAWSP